ncbi:MAG: ABC transporter ATP-binding protein [Actinomycetota bacterium]
MRMRILELFRPYHRLIVLGSIVTGLAAGLSVLPALLVRRIIDDAIPSGNHGLLVALVASMLVFELVAATLAAARRYLATVVAERVINDIRIAMYGSIRQQGMRFFSGVKAGELIDQLTVRAGAIDSMVVKRVSRSVSNSLIVIATLVTMLIISPWLAIASAASIPLVIWLSLRSEQQRESIAATRLERTRALSSLMEETLGLSGAIHVKTFGRDAYEEYRFSNESREIMRASIRSSASGRWVRILSTSAWMLIPSLAWLIGGYGAIRGSLSVGSIVAITLLQARVLAPASALAVSRGELRESVEIFSNCFQLIDLKPEISERSDAVKLVNPQGGVTFDRVTFGYRADAPVIIEVSFEIPPGRTLALVGPAGAGRKTIGHLLVRLYDPWEGSVQIDGHDLRDCTLESLAAAIGVIVKESHLLAGSIRENLLYANHDASEAQLSQAAKLAQVYELITSLPDGFDTVIGDRGYELAPHEMQRIAIAQAMLKDPAVVLIDESSVGADASSDKLVQRALGELRRGRTALIMAHRQATVLSADQILVLDRGRIAERGTHTELLAERGLYARLYKEQFATEPRIADVIA